MSNPLYFPSTWGPPASPAPQPKPANKAPAQTPAHMAAPTQAPDQASAQMPTALPPPPIQDPSLGTPTPSLPPDTVVVSQDGKFLINGQSYDLLGLIFMVEKAASQHAKERLALSVQDLQDANRKSKHATDWLNTLRSKRPSGSDGTVTAADITTAKNAYVSKYGESPFTDTGTTNMYKTSGSYSQSEMDQMIEGTKSYMSTINNDQQMIQLDTERYTHMVDETSESMASIEKAMSNAIESIISKI